MEAIELSKDRVDEFKNYCRSYRKDLDDSFLYDEDLERFKVNKDKAVGSIRCSLDEYEAESLINIESISVLPEYQSKGLGKILLRTGINFARKNSYKRIILCVNGDNEKAKSLYIKEGFKEVKALVCYYLDCH